MNWRKAIAIALFVFLFGAILEAMRIFTSSDKDIVANRASMIPRILILIIVISISAFWFWRKGSKNSNNF